MDRMRAISESLSHSLDSRSRELRIARESFSESLGLDAGGRLDGGGLVVIEGVAIL